MIFNIQEDCHTWTSLEKCSKESEGRSWIPPLFFLRHVHMHFLCMPVYPYQCPTYSSINCSYVLLHISYIDPTTARKNMSQAEEPENNSTEESPRGESIRKNRSNDERRSQVLGRSPSELPDGWPPETLRSLENGKLDKQHVWKKTLSAHLGTPHTPFIL